MARRRRRRRPGPVRATLYRGARSHSFRRPSTRPAHDWRTPVDGRAPRLGPREYIGHTTRGVGAWEDRDPMVTPRWWRLGSFAALVGSGLLAGATGWMSWRSHGGRDWLFDPERE